MSSVRITTWIGWYSFARATLDYRHREAVAYANVRRVEVENREALRRRAA